MPQRIQRKRSKRWRMPLLAVYVGRPTRWGNPYSVQQYGRTGAVEHFRLHVARLAPAEREALLRPLRGKDLACLCALDEACHADVWLEWANR